MTDHPITPPPELVQQWAQYHDLQEVEALWRTIATQAARWGADQARAALAEPQPTADGEVAATGKPGLQVEPIPVSERLPDAGDCDAEGRCWQEELATATEPPAWNLVHRTRVVERAPNGRWLPAHALPLPEEVE